MHVWPAVSGREHATMWTLSVLLFVAAAVGSFTIALQLYFVRRFMLRPLPRPSRTPAISILKPLCGVDDSLEENLRSFAALDYPDYEVVLGLESATDRAWPIARAIVARWPRRFRIAFQQGAPGYNPKVNQLITLAREARHDILVVSDSNVRVDPLSERDRRPPGKSGHRPGRSPDCGHR
jgi:ceramide glucosyltransferase